MSTQFKADVLQYMKDSLCNTQAKLRIGENDCLVRIERLLLQLGQPPRFTTLRWNTSACADALEACDDLRRRLTQQYARRGRVCPEISVHPQMTDCLVVRNVGPSSFVPFEKEVIVDVACGMAVLRGADIYVQGILGAPSSLTRGDVVAVYIDLDGLCRKGFTKVFDGPKQFVGNGIAEVSRQEVFCSEVKLSGVGVLMTEPLYVAPSLSDLAPNLLFPQNLPSIACVHVLDPQPGETVLDMCAAPGGKTTHIAALMKNTGRVVALDKCRSKLEKIRGNAARLGLTCVEVYGFDSTHSVSNTPGADGGPPYLPGTFDRVLLDAPCSGLGQRPAIRNKMSRAEVTSYPALQKHLFKRAVELVGEGGTLVYSTCTITIEENESIVAWALATFPCIQLAQQTLRLGAGGWPGSSLTPLDESLLQRFDPSVVDPHNDDVNIDTIGFFIAKFVKNSTDIGTGSPDIKKSELCKTF